MTIHPHVTLAVLAGGRATRLDGAIKPLLPLAGGTPDTPLSRMIDMARGRFPAVLVVTPDAAPYASWPVRVVADRVAGLGPLGGLEASLSAAATPFVLVLAGDMPSVLPALVDRMAGMARAGRPLVPRRAGRIEPLHAIYPVACLPMVRSALDGGVRMMRDLLDRMEVDYLADEQWSDLDGADRSFENINTAEDLSRARLAPWSHAGSAP